MSANMPLTTLLDAIWHHPGDRKKLASELLARAEDEDLLALTFCLLNSAFEGWLSAEWKNGKSIALALKSNGQRATARVVSESSELAIVRFSDIDAAVQVDNVIFKEGWGDARVYSAVDLLLAMEFARDHSDAILMQPPESRQQSWRDTSAALGVSEGLLRELSAGIASAVQRIDTHR